MGVGRPHNRKKMKNLFRNTAFLWLVAIGSCAIGDGLKESTSFGWGAGLVSLGTGIVLYLLFIEPYLD